MNYGNMTTSIALMEYDWVRTGIDKMVEPIHKRDEIDFMLANFPFMLQPPIDAFVFSSQIQQVFYSDVILH